VQLEEGRRLLQAVKDLRGPSADIRVSIEVDHAMHDWLLWLRAHGEELMEHYAP